jgi:hypothetical protein
LEPAGKRTGSTWSQPEKRAGSTWSQPEKRAGSTFTLNVYHESLTVGLQVKHGADLEKMRMPREIYEQYWSGGRNLKIFL